MRILYTFLVYLISIGYSSVYAAKSYTWTGATNGNWQITSNWSPNTGFPVDGDDVTISAGTNVPKLDQARTFKNFTISGNKSLDLNGFTLSISGTATFTSGAIISSTGNGAVSVNGNSNSTFGSAGNTMTFGSFANNVNVQSICPRIFVNGPLTVNGNLEFEKTKTTADSWVSGITVNGNAKITCSQNGGSSGIIIGTTAGVNLFNGNLELNNSSSSQIILGGISGSTTTINGNVKLTNTNTGSVDFAYSTSGNTTTNNATININGNIEFNNTSTGSIGFGRNSTLSTPAITLASNKGIAVGTDGGFTNGTIIFRRFTYSGTSPFNFTTTGGSVNFLDNSTFNCPITISAANIALNGTTFNGAVDFTKTNNTAYNGTGFNTFNQSVSLTNTGTSNWIFGTTNPDIFNKPVTFRNTNTGAIYVGYSSIGNQFNDNIILDETGTGSIRFGNTTSNPITFAEGKTITTANSTSPGLIIFNKITFPPNSPINLDLGCTAGLNFISCTLNSSVNVKAGSYEFQSNNFNAPVTVEKCGSVTGTNDLVYGGNIFSLNAPVHFINSSLIHLVLCQSAPDIYNADFTLTSSNNNYIYASYVANGTQYNGNITLNKTAGIYGFDFGNGTNAFSTLAEGKAITLNASSALAANWILSIRKITQNGNANPINITSGNYCILTLTQNEFNSGVNVTSAGAIQLAANTFWQPSSFETTGAIAATGNGGNNFKSTVIFKHSGTANWIHANAIKDVFENDVTINSINTGSIYLAYNSLGNEFKGDIIINKNSGTGSIIFGNTTNASLTLAGDKTIKLGDSGFNSGSLIIQRLTQLSNSLNQYAPISIAATGGTLSFGSGNTIGGDMTLTAGLVNFNGTGSIYNGNVIANINAAGGSWTGNVIFNGDVLVNYSSITTNSSFIISNTSTGADNIEFHGNATFNRNERSIFAVARYGTVKFFKDITYNRNSTLGAAQNEFGYGGGKVLLAGDNIQHISSNQTVLQFCKLEINKSSNNVILNVPIILNTVGTVPAELDLTKGNIVTTSATLLSLSDNAIVSGGGATSFVDGPLKKIGNDGFTFPIGKGNFYTPITISAPTAATEAFLAEAFITTPPSSSNLDASINTISNCQYWNLQRVTGSSSVKVTLPWDASTCTPVSPSMKVAKLSGSTWTDAGANNLINTPPTGSITSNDITTANTSITFAYDAPLAATVSKTDPCFGLTNGTVTLVVTGGKKPYSYLWNNGATTQNLNSLTDGSYNVTVTDALGAMQAASVTLNAGTEISVVLNLNGRNILSTVSGGIAPYTYLWSNNSTSANQTALASDSYTLTVTDANGCTNSTPASVTVIDPLTQRVVRIAAGNRHSIKICDGGTLYAWGNNNFGQLGDGSTTEKIVPTDLSGTTGFVSASAGVDYTIALKNDGSVWAWGNNEYGQLGIGNSTESHIPVQINSLTNIVAISAGKYHSLALKNDGTVYAWGKNNYGQLGNGTNIDSNIPVLIPNLSGVIALATGETHSVILKSDGTVWTFGDNIGGQLGNGTWDTSYEPVLVSDLTGVKAISSGEGHTIVLKNDGTVWTWGYSGSASLGDGNTYNSNVPRQLTTLSGITSIIAGETYGLALKNDGTVWVWGENGDGQLGDGTYNDHPTPVQLSSPKNIIELAAGDGHSMVLNGDGILYSFGDNRNGQLGDGTKEDRIVPVSVYVPGGCFVPDCSTLKISAGTDQTIFRGASVTLSGSGATSYAWDNGVSDGVAFNPTTTTVYNVTGKDDRGCSDTALVKVTVLDPLTQKSVKISAGSFQSAKLCDDGSLYVWGASFTGNKTTPYKVPDFTGGVNVSSNSSNTLVLKNDGTVWAVGQNSFGQLGNGNTQNSSTFNPVLNLANIVDIICGEHSIALRSDGTVWEWGHIHSYDFNLATTPIKVSGLENVVNIAGDGSTFFALKIDGTVWAWGYNYWGNVGDGTTQDRDVPVQILSNIVSVSSLGGHSLALQSDGTVLGWGYNAYGEVGSGLSGGKVLTPGLVQGLSGVAKIIAGQGNSFVIKNDGTVWAWGKNDAGQFGNGTTTNSLAPIQISSFSDVNEISGGSLHTLVLKNDGILLVAGSNGYGQLGDGSPTTTVGKGGGLPTYKSIPTSVYVPGGCFVPNCSTLTVNAGNDQTLSYGSSLTLTAAVTDATSVIWNNGITNGVAFNPPVGSTSYIVTASNDKGCLITDTVDIKVELLQSSVKLAACDHSVKVCDDGTVYTWGLNIYGALGDGTTASRNYPAIVPNLKNVVAVSAGVTNTLALKNDGTVWAWGLNLHGNLGNGTMNDANSPVQVSDLTGIVSMDTKFHHVLALKNDGTVWAWGYNVYGELGQTGITTSTRPLMVPGLNGIIAVETGSYHSVALKVDGTVWTWGRNGSGELGDGSTIDRYLPMQVNGLVNVKQISALTQATYALTQDGHLYAWGANSGLIGDGTTSTYSNPIIILSDVAEILSGGSQTIIIKKNDGTIWGWGTNTFGQLNDGSTTNRSTPVLLSNFYSNDLVCLGSSHVLIQNNDGTLFSEGYNANGQLGDGTNTNQYTPVSIYVPGGCFKKLACSITNTNDSGPGSLRAAIQCANNNPGRESIFFNIPDNLKNANGKWEINLSSGIMITDGIDLVGPVNGTDNLVVIKGNGVTGLTFPKSISNGGSVQNINFDGLNTPININVKDFIISNNNFSNNYYAIVHGGEESGTKILANHFYNNTNDVYGCYGCTNSNLTIGEEGQGNIFESSVETSVMMFLTDNAKVQYNIFKNCAGDGMVIRSGAKSNTLSKNYFYSITGSSIHIHSGAESNIISENFIGIDENGNEIGNTGDGIFIEGWQNNQFLSNKITKCNNGIKIAGSVFNTIVSSNYIYGNKAGGILLTTGAPGSSNPSGNSFTNNFIGINSNGTIIGNQLEGILAVSAPVNNFGAIANGNIIKGNAAGIVLRSSNGSSVLGNIITNNNGDGVTVQSNGITLNGNTIGQNAGYSINVLGNGNNIGTISDPNNFTSSNLDEVIISGMGTQVAYNTFYPTPGKKAIALDLTKVPAMTTPVITSNSFDGINITLNGTGASNDEVLVYLNNGFDQTAVQYISKTVVPDGTSNWTITIPLSSFGTVTEEMNFIAHSMNGNNTSEFSDKFKAKICLTCCIVTNTNDSGPGSLREAINCANSSNDPSTIAFNIPGDGDHIMNITSAKLPDILYSTVIDGSTQPSGKVVIANYGWEGFNFKNGIANQSSVINAINYINSYAVAYSSQQSLRINNVVGDKLTFAFEDGTTADSLIITNSSFKNGEFIAFGNHAPKFVSVQNCIIDNCPSFGIYSNATFPTTEFQIINNKITHCHASYSGAIDIYQAKSISIFSNQISGNLGYGINLAGIKDKSAIKGNIIGLSFDKKSAMPNQMAGVNISGCNTVIIDSNYIGGNNADGIDLNGSIARITRNYIGTNENWDNLGNGSGIYMLKEEGTVIGGSTLDSANVIGFNRGNGIVSNYGGTIIQKNYIGVSPTFVNIGNNGSGIWSEGEEQKFIGNYIGFNKNSGISNFGGWQDVYSNNFIGGDLVHNFPNGKWGLETYGYGVVKNNIISNNTLGGITVMDSELKISQNIFKGSQPVAISLGGYANNNKQPGTFTTSSFTSTSLTLNGTGNDGDSIEVFHNDGVSETALVYAGYAVVTNGKWTLTIPQGPAYDPLNDNYYVNTATDADGNTSQLSALYKVGFCIVINTDDSGPGSLREAINCANSLPYVGRIKFAIPGNGTYEINLQSPIAVTNPFGIILNGNTQIASGAGASGTEQSVKVKSSMIVFTQDAGPSSVTNMSFSDYAFGLFSMADSFTVRDNKFYGSGVRVILSSTPNAGKVDLSNNTFDQVSAAIDCESINGLTIQNNIVNASGSGSPAVFIRQSTNVNVRENNFDNTLTSIYSLNNNKFVVRNNNVRSSVSGTGIAFSFINSKNVNIDTNNVLGRTLDFTGISLNQCDTGTVNRNNIYGVKTGLLYSVANDFSIDHNNILNFTDGIIYSNNYNQRLLISNNTVRNGSGIGLLIGGINLNILNNYVDTVGTGIRTVSNQGVLNNCVFANNQVYNFTQGGIDIGQGDNNSFHHNTIGKGSGFGIRLFRGHSNLKIYNNFIGISPQFASLPIQGHGIVIGMTNASGGPLIKYNQIGNITDLPGSPYGQSSGIISSSGGVQFLSIQNNYIGIDSLNNPHPIQSYGLLLRQSPINGDVQNNIVANTAVGLHYENSTSNLIKHNSFINILNPIELSTGKYNHITVNDFVTTSSNVINLNLSTPQVANEGKPAPSIASFKLINNEATITGHTEPGDVVEIYQATGTSQVTYSYLMTVTADPSTGFWIASLPLATLKDKNLRSVLYATATDVDNNTSQFSTGYPICPICECVVTNINDSGDGSFREAINCANSLGNGSKIKFNIPSASIDTIKITTTMLPSFLYNVEVDGSSQPGFVAGQSPKIFIKNASGVSRGLVFTQANSSIRGIGMKNFAPSLIFTSDADNSLVEYCTVINDGFSIALSGDGDNIQIMGCHFGITQNGDGQGSGNAPGLVINNAIIGSKDKPNVITNYFYAGIWGNNTVLYNTIYGNGDPSTKKAIYSPDRIPNGHSAVYENFVWKIKGVAPAKSRIQLFLNNGIQQQALAYVDELFADANGNWTYIVPNQYLPVTKNSYFVYTYTEATSGLTSELSSVITVGNFATQCFVTNTNNDGSGSLRYAINNCANPAPNHAEIIFQLPDNGARINGSLIPVSRTIEVYAPSFQFSNPNGITMDGTAAWVKLVAKENVTTTLTSNSNSNIISRIAFDGSNASGAVDLGGNYSVVTNCEITNSGFRSGSIYGNNHVISNNYIHGITVEDHQGIWLQGNNLNFTNNYIGIKPDGTDSKVKVSSFGSVVVVGDKVTVQNNTIGNIDTAAVGNTTKAAIFVYNSSFGKVNILNNTIGKYNGRAIPVPTIGIALTGCDNTDCPTNDLISGNTIANCRFGISARGNGDTISNNTFIDISEVAIQNFGKMTLDPITNPDHVSYLTRNLIFNTPAGKKAILSDIANPVITRFYHGTWDWLIEGTSIPNATIELFLNDGLGENAIKYLNTIKANESGYWKLSVPDDVIDVEQEYLYVTATATTTDYATSGLSNIGVLHILKCTVESTENSGPKTLRECITQANEGTVNYIKFNITTGELPVDINITEALPTITTLAKGLIINGATQPGNLPSEQYNKIVVKNDDEVSYGFTIGDVTGVALRNISVKDFATGLYYTGTANKTKAVHVEITGHTASGVLVDATCGDSVRVTNSRIKGNRLAEYGINNHAAGAYFDTLLVDGHTKSGIYVEGTPSKLVSDVVIAGDTLTNNYPEDKETQTDYTGGIVGMYMKDSKVSGNIAYENNYALFLGFASNNDISENNSYNGVNTISESTQNDTIINVGNGVDALHTLSSSGNTISSNEFSYCMNGISLNSSNDNKITAGTVSYNKQRGIEVAASTGVTIESVTLYSNEYDGIYVGENSDETVIKKCHVGSSDKNFQIGYGNKFYGVNLLSSNNSVTDNIIGFNKNGAVNVSAETSSNKVVRNYLSPNPSNPRALSININYNGNTSITPPTITSQSSSGKFITLSGDGVDDGDSVHIYRNRGYIQEANTLLAAVKAEGNSWTATIDTTLLFDNYSAYVVATTTDQDNNTSQLSEMYSLGYCMVNTQDDNGRNDYPTNASLRMAVNCVNSSQVKARLMVNIEGVKNPVINLKGSVLPAIFNDHGVDMNGRNRFFGFIKETKLQVQRDASVSETLGGDYIFELTNNVDKASIKNFVINNGRGIKAESDTIQIEKTTFFSPYTSLYNTSFVPSLDPATSQGLWLSGNTLAEIHKVTIDSFSNGLGAYQVIQLRVDSSLITNSAVGLYAEASINSITFVANNFEDNKSAGVFLGPLNYAEMLVSSNTFSGQGIGMTLLGAKHASISGNTFNTIVPNSASTILDSDNNNAIGIYLIDSTGTVQILNNTFNNVRGAAISFDKDAEIGGLSYVGTAYPDSVLIYQNKVLGDTIAFNIKGRSHSIHHNNVMGSILVKESKRSHIYLNTISGRNGFVNMASSDSVVVSKNAITGFIGRNDSKSIHLNKGTAKVSNGGKNAPRFNQSSLVANSGRIRVAITGKAHPFDDVELFKSDTLNPYLISYVNTVSANASGDWTYIVPTEEVPIKKGDFYIATATSPDTLRTSEASSIYYLPVQKYDIIVRNTNDAGANSLRNALNLVTMYDPFVNVKFRIPGNGPYRISIDSAFKAVTSENGFTLDVNTQVDYAIDSSGLNYDDDLRVIVDGSHLAGTTSLDTAAIEVDKGPNKSFIRALNVENFKRGYLLKSAEFRLSSLRLHNENPTTLEGTAVELDSTTAEKIVIDTVNVDNFDIAFLLRDTIAGGNSISNSAIENVNTGFMLEDCDRMKLTNNTIVKFNVAGIHWTLEDTTKVKTKDEDFAVIKDNYIGFLPYETVSASSGTGIILDGVKEETINANYIGNLIGDVDGIKLIGNSRKLIIKSNIIGEDDFGNAQPIVGNGIQLMSDGDTLTENFISANNIKNVSGAGVVLHGTRGNMVAANNIGDTVTSTIGYGVIVKGWSSTKTAANERVYDNKIYNYTQHGIFCEYADSVTMNRNILMSKLAPATSKGINLNLLEGSASNNSKQAPAITDMRVLNASTMEIKGDGVAGEKIELFTTTDENTIQALDFAGHTVVDSDNHWKLLVYPPLVRFDKPVYVVATATEGGTGRTSELSLVKVKTKALCDLHSQDLLPDSARICPADKYIADLKLGKEMSYEWSLDGEVISYMTQSKSDLSKPGNYSIVVKDLGQGDELCSLTVNFKLNYLDAPYTPKILMATEVVAGDTIAAFDVADSTEFKYKNTDNWEWTKDSTVLIWDIEPTDPHEAHRKYNMVFPAPGTYQIKLTTTNEGPCKEEDSKTITVYDQAALKQMQSDMPTELLEVLAYPNPSDGDFAVKVTLNKWDDIYLDLYSSTGVLVYSTEARFKKQHVFGISSNGLASGMYFVSIRSGNMRQIVKVVLSK